MNGRSLPFKYLKNGFYPALQYKGFTILYIRGEYRAASYANPTFYDTNSRNLIKQINKYLRDECN